MFKLFQQATQFSEPDFLQKMSKIETLLVAQTYIKALAKLMDSVAEEEEDEMVSRISLRN